MLNQRTEPPVAVALLILAGAATKAALIPTHFWLPAAMAAPTPVSAYLHAAAMVKAGVYLVARFAPIFAPLPAWRWAVTVLGLGTMLLGGYRALRQYDLKLLLAFGTVSQLGFIVLLVGQGTRGAALAGLAMIGAHAVFKAGLFLSVGVVDAATSCRDLRRLSGLGRAIPVTAVGAALCVASMMGVAPLSGFVAKETAFEEFTTSPVLLVGIVLGSILTVAYGLRFWWGAFATKRTIAIAPTEEKPRLPGQPEHAVPGAAAPPAPISQPPLVMSGPVLLLGLAGLVMGLLPNLGERWLAPHANTYPTGAPGHLVLWAGFTPILLLSLAVLATGVLLFYFREPIARVQATFPAIRSAEDTFHRSMRGLDRLAVETTARTQRGSLPVYVGTILVTFVVLTTYAMLDIRFWPDVTWFDSPIQVAVGAVMAILLAVDWAALGEPRAAFGRFLLIMGGQQVLVAGFEELAFRGVIQALLIDRLGSGRGLAAAAGLFGLFHLPNLIYQDVPGGLILVALLNLTVMGEVFGAAYERSGRRLALPFALHLGWNLAAYSFEGGFHLQLSGPAAIAGDPAWFPETGLAALVGLALAGTLVWGWPRFAARQDGNLG